MTKILRPLDVSIENKFAEWYHSTMIKKFLIIFLIFLFTPVFAGEFEDALASKKNVVLYLYTKKCGYCVKFSPIFDKMSKMYDKHYAFVKIDANTQYGYSIFKKYHGRYVPYVIIIDSKTQRAFNVQSSCLADSACFEKALTGFNK